MGWAYCGTDSEGREIGYGIEATCDEPGCDAKIDRGLGYACGQMHGEDTYWCEKYFCGKHLFFVTWPQPLAGGHPDGGTVCRGCMKAIEESAHEEVIAALEGIYDEDDARRWLDAPHDDLEGLTPSESIAEEGLAPVLAIVDRLRSAAYI